LVPLLPLERPLPPEIQEKCKQRKAEREDDESVEAEAVLNEGEKTIIPSLIGEEDCLKLVAEGDCNPRAWSIEEVSEFLKKNDLEEAAKKLAKIVIANQFLN